MSVIQNKLIARSYLDRVWNKGETKIADELIDSEYIFRSPIANIEGLGGFLEYLNNVRSVFPDLYFTNDEMIAENDRVVTLWTMSGTQKKDYLDIPATGKSFSITGVSILRFARGKLVETQLSWDRYSLMKQLGAFTTGEPVG